MTPHEAWTEKLSDYLDDELPAGEREAVEKHLAECGDCARTLEELQRVVAVAAALPPRPPRAELWSGIARGIERTPRGRWGISSRRVSLTVPQLAAASLLLAALSGGAVALLLRNQPPAPASRAADGGGSQAHQAAATPAAEAGFAVMPAVSYGDEQYDAAVADLERTLERGRGRLDPATVEIVEQNLAIIDRAIAEARTALDADPSNGYLSGHLMEARRRKLDLLRRAAELAETN